MIPLPNQIHVLHVEDDPLFAEMAGEFIKRQDERFILETALTAEEALDRLRTNQIHCVVSDFDMPGKNGIELLEAIREEYPNLPFILFTGRGSEEIAAEAITAGVTDYLQKGSDSSRYAILAQRITNAVQAAMAEKELQETLSRVTDAVYTVDTDWRITYVNEGTEEIMGPKEEILGENLWEQFPEAAEGVIWEKFHAAMETQEPKSFEVFYEPLDLWAAATAYPSPTGLTVYFQDITEQKEQNLQLQRERNRFQAVFEKATDAMVIADDDGRYLDANPQAAELFGLDREELIGQTIREFAPDDYDFETAWEQFQQSGRDRGTFPLIRADGEQRTVEYAAAAEIVKGEHLSILRDVTARGKPEEEL